MPTEGQTRSGVGVHIPTFCRARPDRCLSSSTVRITGALNASPLSNCTQHLPEPLKQPSNALPQDTWSPAQPARP